MRRLRSWSGSPRSRARESIAKSTFIRKTHIIDLEDCFSCFCRTEPNALFFPKQWYTEGFWRLGKDIHECFGRSVAPVARQLLCTGCGLGKGQVALVHAKRSVAPLSTEKHICFGTISFRSSPGPPLAQMPPSFPLLPDVSKIAPPQERSLKKSFDFFVT